MTLIVFVCVYVFGGVGDSESLASTYRVRLKRPLYKNFNIFKTA